MERVGILKECVGRRDKKSEMEETEEGRGREMKKVLKGEVDDRKRDEKGKMDQIFELLNHLQSVQ